MGVLKIFILSIFFFASQVFAKPSIELDISRIQNGDLIFMDLDCGEMCQAIIDVTKAQLGGGPDISHIGQIERTKQGDLFVYEALPDVGVKRTPWNELLLRLQKNRSSKTLKERIIIGKIRPESKILALNGLEEIKGEVGKRYNDLFTLENADKFYCSQLLQAAWSKANEGQPFFTWRPMTFGKAGSKGRLKWEEYFKLRGVTLPEGKPGISPLGIFHEGKGRVFDLLEWPS